MYIPLLISPLCVRGQDPFAIRYTVEDGLPSNEIYNGYEDREGNLWLATDHGISKFDGYTFTNYSTRDGLSNNTVFEFIEDVNGIVWMRCFDGSLSCMKDGKIFPYPHNDTLKAQLQNGFMADFDLDDRGNLYFTLFQGDPIQTMVLDLRTGSVKPYFQNAGNVAGVLDYGNPHHRIGLVHLNRSNSIKTTPLPRPDISCTDGLRIWSMEEYRTPSSLDGRILNLTIDESTDAGICGHMFYALDSCRFTGLRRADIWPMSIQKDHQNRIWTIGHHGIQCYDTHLRLLETYFHGETCLGMYISRRGEYWIFTTQGVLRVPSFDRQVYESLNGQLLETIRRVKVRDSVLYMLHGDHHFLAGDLRTGHHNLELQPVPSDQVKYLHDFIPWTNAGKPSVLTSTTDIRESGLVPDIHLKINVYLPFSFTEDTHGYFMALSNGFQLMHRDTNAHNMYVMQAGMPCIKVVRDAAGVYWVGTTHGIYTYTAAGLQQYGAQNPLLATRITDLQLLPDGTLLAATRGKGILIIRQNRVSQLDSRHGLPTDMVTRLYLGQSGLWICSNQGLTLLREAKSPAGSSWQFLHYTVLDGLPSNKVNDVLEYGGKVYAGTEKGLLVMPATAQSIRLPEARITEVKANVRTIPPGVSPDAGENNLLFRFESKKLPSPSGLIFTYMLEGFDHEWRKTSDNIVSYPNLPPGDYTFRVYAGLPYTGAHPREARFRILLPRHLYQKGWFLGLMLVLALGLCFLAGWRLYAGRQRRLQSRFSRLKAEVKALRIQMRPHFIYNVLNSIQQLILLRDTDEAQAQLARFAKLMRGVLDASSHESIPIAREAELLALYLELEKLRIGDRFRYHIDLEPGVNWHQVFIPPMLLQPLVENAIWHGLRPRLTDQQIWLRFRRMPDGSVRCEVEDNGIGRQAARQRPSIHRESTSISLSNIEARIQLLNAIRPGNISLHIQDLEQDGIASGTRVIIRILPYPHESQNRKSHTESTHR